MYIFFYVIYNLLFTFINVSVDTILVFVVISNNTQIVVLLDRKEIIMKYMGSKNRIAKYLLPIMLEEAKKQGITKWVEPFLWMV